MVSASFLSLHHFSGISSDYSKSDPPTRSASIPIRLFCFPPYCYCRNVYREI